MEESFEDDSETIAQSEALDAFFNNNWAACEAGDVPRLKEIYKQSEQYLELTHLLTITTISIRRGWAPATQCMLELGVEPLDIPLVSIAACRNLETFKVLAEYGYDFRKANGILHSMLDHREIFEWLLDQGLDINHLGGVGWLNDIGSVLNDAAKRGDIDMFEYLVSRGAKPKLSIALHFAAKCTDAEKCVAMIRHLVEVYEFDVNAPHTSMDMWKLGTNLEQGDPISWALVSDNLAAVEALLGLGADATRTLIITINSDMLPAAKICLENGAKIEKAEERDIVPRTTAMRDLLGRWKYGYFTYSTIRFARDVFGRRKAVGPPMESKHIYNGDRGESEKGDFIVY